MRASAAATVVLACAAAGTPLAAQAGGDVEVRLTGRIQVQYNTTSAEEAESGALPWSTFETRRIRLAAQIAVDDWITGMIEPEYALGDLQLRLAWINLGFTDAFQLRLGQMKKPFGRIFLESSTQTAAIERGLRIRGLADELEAADQDAGGPVLTAFGGGPLIGEEQYILDTTGYQGYDLGAALHGELGRVRYEVGMFNGSGSDRRDENDAKAVAARLSAAPGATVPLTLGIAATHHQRFAGAAEVDGNAVELFAEWSRFRQTGLHVIAELVAGSTMVVDDSFLAAQGVASYFQPVAGRIEGVEPVARVSWGDTRRDVEGDAGLLLTPGINLYFLGRNRLLLNWDVYLPEGDRFETTHALRAQAQVHF
jgi:hypothetical protein